MNKQNLKRICVGLLLTVAFFFMSFRPAAAGFGAANAEMAAICDTWGENIADYSDQSHCWSCEIFVLLFDSSNTIAGQINKTLAKPVMGLVIMGGMLWLAFCTVAFFSNISGPSDPMEFLTKVGTIMLRVGFAGCFLAGGASLAFEYIINPVLSSGVRLASDVFSMTNAGSVALPNDISGSASGPMGAGVRDGLKALISQLASSMAEAQAIAQGLRCGAFFWKKFEGLSFGVGFLSIDLLPEILVPNPLMWAVGAWTGCMFWIISILFCFAMLDVVFRIGLLVGLLPVFIASWVFPMTGRFAKTAWSMFVNSVLVFFITAITASFIVIFVKNAWNISSSSEFGTFLQKMQASSYVEAWDSLFEAGAGAGLLSILFVFAVVYWGWMMAPKADKTASEILQSSFSSSIAIKALSSTVNFIIDLIMLVITIVTVGLGAIVYVLKFARFFIKAAKAAKKLRDIQKKIEKLQKLQEKVNKIHSKAKKVQSKVKNAANKYVPSG